ncbi:MAG: hypothetical protein OET90_09205, partial [Desulfuromonadales bacterium]|nr:hypothetical protein [Desulfuromonadales bacterium]
MAQKKQGISPLFLSDFQVDHNLPFQRHLNRLETEIGREDYSRLKRVERVDAPPSEEQFLQMEELTERLFKTTQNGYNRDLLKRLGVRIYLDPPSYSVYYRSPSLCVRFVPHWRNRVLQRFFGSLPLQRTGWKRCEVGLPGFEARYLDDSSGGVLLLRHRDESLRQSRALLTASHGPFDPHTLETTIYFLRTGKGGAAMINLGFSGREPLSDPCLQQLVRWGFPLNPSNIDVIYPYGDATGHPYCFKAEEGLAHYVSELEMPLPPLVIDIHGCVGAFNEDRRVVVGLGGLPPYPDAEHLGALDDRDGVLQLSPGDALTQGLSLLRDISSEIYVQFCRDAHHGYNFSLLGRMQMLGSHVDLKRDVQSLVEGEVRTFLPLANLRWLPGAGANALQRIEARKLNADTLCLHVEIPTSVRRKVVLKLRELEIE